MLVAQAEGKSQARRRAALVNTDRNSAPRTSVRRHTSYTTPTKSSKGRHPAADDDHQHREVRIPFLNSGKEPW